MARTLIFGFLRQSVGNDTSRGAGLTVTCTTSISVHSCAIYFSDDPVCLIKPSLFLFEYGGESQSFKGYTAFPVIQSDITAKSSTENQKHTM